MDSQQKKTTLAYRCPVCGGVPTSMVGIFSLSGDLFKLKCSCGGSHMTLEKQSSGRLGLTVPCLICSTPHYYVVSSQAFFGSERLVIPCNISGLDICFIGTEENVAQAVKESNEMIIKAVGDSAIERLKSGEDQSSPCDPQINEIVSFVIADLAEEGKIHCGCQDGQGDYECTIHNDFISVRCKKCGKSTAIPNDSTIAAYDFLNADQITLS